MALNAFEVFAKLSLDSSEYDSSLKAAESEASSFGSKLSSAFKAVGVAATAVAGTVTGISAAFIKSAGDVASYGDNIDKMSQKMGMSAKSYQEWDAVMQHSGTSMETLKASMKTLANAAQTGSEAFTALGISQEEIKKLSQEQLFDRTITALQNVTDETQRTYLASKTLGRGATELGALLNTSAEDTQKMKDRVHELGGVMSDEAVKAAAAYQDSLQDMSTAFAGLKRNLTSEFLPSIKSVMDGLTDLFAGDFEKGLQGINEGVKKSVDSLSDELPKVIEVGTNIVLALADAITDNLPKLFEAGSQAVTQLATGIISNLPAIGSAALQAVQSLVDGITTSMPNLAQQGADVIVSLANGIAKSAPELIKSATEAISIFVEEITKPDKLNEIIDAGVEMVGALLSGVVEAIPKLVDTAIDAAGNLLSALPGLEGFGKFIKEHKELVEAAAGAWLVYKAAVAIGNIVSAASTAIKGLVSAIGAQTAALTGATAAQTALNVVMAAAPYVAAAAAITAVTAELTYYYNAIFDVSEGVKKAQKAQEEFVASINAGHTAADMELDQLQRKADKYEELRNTQNRSAEQERQLKALAQEMQTALGNEIEVVNSATGEYNDLSNAVDNYIEAKKREAQISVYQDKLKQAYEEMYKVEEEMERRKEEFANRGFNLLDWYGKVAEYNFRNDMIALNKTRQEWEGVIDDISGKMENKLDEAKRDVDNKFNDLADSVYAAEQRLAAYAPAKFIPTEALRQMEGGAAPTISLLEKGIKDTADAGATLLSNTASTESSLVKQTLTFAYANVGEYKKGSLGIVKRIGEAISEADEKLDRIASTVWSRDQSEVQRRITNESLNTQEQLDLWTKVRDQYVINSEQWIAANDKVIASEKKLEEENTKSAENMASSAKKQAEAIQTAYESMQEGIANAQDEYSKAVADRADEIMNQYGLFDEVPARVQKSGDQLMKNLTEQVAATKKFYSDIEKLSERGVSDDLVESIRAMGVKAGDELDAILDMTDEQLKEYDDKFKEKKELSTGFAETQLEPLKEETEQKIAALTADYSETIAQSGTEIATMLISNISTGMQTGAETVVADVKDATTKAWKEAFGTEDMTSVGTIAPELTTNATVNNDNKFQFTFNGVQFQNLTAMAKALANEMQFLLNRKKAGYAGT